MGNESLFLPRLESPSWLSHHWKNDEVEQLSSKLIWSLEDGEPDQPREVNPWSGVTMSSRPGLRSFSGAWFTVSREREKVVKPGPNGKVMN